MCASSYWDWGADADAMEKSPVSDGSDTSLSGNGASIPTQLDTKVLGNYTSTVLPPGTGGGCVTSDSCASYTVNMGPSFLPLPGAGGI
jgi:tyrosinase